MAGEGDWTCINKVLGWWIYTEAGMSALPEPKTPRAPPTARHPSHATMAGTEGTGALGGVTPCDAWSGSTPLPHPSCLDTGRKRQVLAIGGLPLGNQQLERASGVDGL